MWVDTLLVVRNASLSALHAEAGDSCVRHAVTQRNQDSPVGESGPENRRIARLA